MKFCWLLLVAGCAGPAGYNYAHKYGERSEMLIDKYGPLVDQPMENAQLAPTPFVGEPGVTPTRP